MGNHSGRVDDQTIWTKPVICNFRSSPSRPFTVITMTCAEGQELSCKFYVFSISTLMDFRNFPPHSQLQERPFKHFSGQIDERSEPQLAAASSEYLWTET